MKSIASVAVLALQFAAGCAATPSTDQPPIDASDPQLTQKPTIDLDAKPSAPKYPRSARDERVEGEVSMLMCVSPSGAVSHIGVAESSGDARLDKAAVEWASRLDMKPGRIGDRAVAVCGHRLNLNWDLNY